eukprot:1175523-Prorocentrum_minimum.AAC.1
MLYGHNCHLCILRDPVFGLCGGSNGRGLRVLSSGDRLAHFLAQLAALPSSEAEDRRMAEQEGATLAPRALAAIRYRIARKASWRLAVKRVRDFEGAGPLEGVQTVPVAPPHMVTPLYSQPPTGGPIK